MSIFSDFFCRGVSFYLTGIDSRKYATVSKRALFDWQKSNDLNFLQIFFLRDIQFSYKEYALMLLKIRTLLNLSSRLFVWDFLTYPRCQRLFMRGFRFRSSLKKWPARKASGPERHPFDSAEPITTPLIPKHPESGCSADWFLGDVECFKCSDWITITIGAWWGRGWFEGDEDQIPNNPSTRHVRFRFL